MSIILFLMSPPAPSTDAEQIWTEEARLNTWTEEARQNTWTLEGDMADTLKLAIDIGGTSETEDFYFEFEDRLASGDSLNTVDAVLAEPTSPALTLDTPIIIGTQVQVRVSITGGVVGTVYTLSCRCSTVAGEEPIMFGYLVLVGAP